MDHVAFVNCALQHACIWQVALVTAKIDVKRMFANVPYDVLCATLREFAIPQASVNVTMAQVLCRQFEITAIHGTVIAVDLHHGLIEGAATSVLLIGLSLTRFLDKLHSSARYVQLAVSLPSDSVQPPL